MPQPAHVLIIDDNTDILFMLKAMLSMKGYTVFTKENVDNLENELNSIKPKVIIMDMLLSGTDGREVCKSLKMDPLFSHIPIIMISAHPQAKEECLAAGANNFLEKPFDMYDVLDLVADAVDTKIER
jgi:DNA-binding response OmpR family regulator